jgi:hypothetical protein
MTSENMLTSHFQLISFCNILLWKAVVTYYISLRFVRILAIREWAAPVVANAGKLDV